MHSLTTALKRRAFEQLERRLEELRTPAMSVAFALDPEWIDHEQQESMEYHWDWETVAQEVPGSEDAAGNAKRHRFHVCKSIRNAKMQEDIAMEKDARTQAGY
jgi:hypothetical protein